MNIETLNRGQQLLEEIEVLKKEQTDWNQALVNLAECHLQVFQIKNGNLLIPPALFDKEMIISTVIWDLDKSINLLQKEFDAL